MKCFPIDLTPLSFHHFRYSGEKRRPERVPRHLKRTGGGTGGERAESGERREPKSLVFWYRYFSQTSRRRTRHERRELVFFPFLEKKTRERERRNRRHAVITSWMTEYREAKRIGDREETSLLSKISGK